MRTIAIYFTLLLTLALNGFVATELFAANFPGAPSSDTFGAHKGIYMVLRDVNDSPLSQARIDGIRSSEEQTREFHAANSGGAYDMRYQHILDIPLTLNADRTRPSNWIEQTENYVRNNYSLEPEDFHLNLFDLADTSPDEGQGWAGLAWIPSNNIAVQPDVTSSWGQIVVDHELGHRIGAPHSGAMRNVNDDNYTPYVWNKTTSNYELYNSSEHGHQPLTYGVHKDGYGDPFSVMGNISHEHHSVHTKLNNFGWLEDSQVPDLATEGDLSEGQVYRIYAHNELEFSVNRRGDYGVVDTYDEASLYGLTYTRQAERYNTDTNAFDDYDQTITLEYRSGRDGVQFHLDHQILDMDSEGGTDRNNRERELEVGQSVSDLDFGLSLYIGHEDDLDFLEYGPPAPTDFEQTASDWYEFEVLNTASDLIGSYIELMVWNVEAMMAGDLNDDGSLTDTDVQLFTSNWLADTSEFGYAGKHTRGDMNHNGLVDLDDWWLLRRAFSQQGRSVSLALAVPEPSSALLALFGLTLLSRLNTNRR